MQPEKKFTFTELELEQLLNLNRQTAATEEQIRIHRLLAVAGEDGAAKMVLMDN